MTNGVLRCSPETKACIYFRHFLIFANCYFSTAKYFENSHTTMHIDLHFASLYSIRSVYKV